MITRYKETPGALGTAIAEARSRNEPSKAVLVYHREINGVHVASLVVRVHVRWVGEVLHVEVAMPGRQGNPFHINWSTNRFDELVSLVSSRIDRIILE